MIDNSRETVYGYDQRVEVFVSEGMIAVNNKTQDDQVHVDRTRAHSSLPLHFFLEGYNESYLSEMRAFLDGVRNDKAVPVTGNDGLMSLVIGLAATKSAQGKSSGGNRRTSIS